MTAGVRSSGRRPSQSFSAKAPISPTRSEAAGEDVGRLGFQAASGVLDQRRAHQRLERVLGQPADHQRDQCPDQPVGHVVAYGDRCRAFRLGEQHLTAPHGHLRDRGLDLLGTHGPDTGKVEVDLRITGVGERRKALTRVTVLVFVGRIERHAEDHPLPAAAAGG